MAFRPTFGRIHEMSESSKTMVQKALEIVAESKATKGSPKSTTADLSTGKILFRIAQKTYPNLKYSGFGLYSFQVEDEAIPGIWKKEVIQNPKTGEQEEWLVAYTTDDDDIMRNVSSSQKEAKSPPGKKHEVEELKEKGLPESEAFGIAWKQHNKEHGKHKKEKEAFVSKYFKKIATHISPESLFAYLENEISPENKLRMAEHIKNCPQCKQELKESYQTLKLLYDNADHLSDRTKMPFDTTNDRSIDNMPHQSSLQTTAADNQPTKKEDKAPIAPGVVTKSLNLDQSGVGGNAQVTVNFNDPAKGKEFFDKVEELAGGIGGGDNNAAPAPKKEEAPSPQPQQPQQAGPTPAPQGPATPPSPFASSIKNLTKTGQQIAYIHVEKFSSYPTKYFYVNESGERIDLAWEAPLKIGSIFVRPDNYANIRIANYIYHDAASDDEDLISKIALDVSDRVPPMQWTNKETQNDQGEGGNQPLPPNPALNSNAPPSADTSQPPALYDSSQDAGQKGKFSISIDPTSNEVNVKFNKPQALEDIENAVNTTQPQLNPGVAPQPNPAQQPGQQQQPGPQGQPKQDFDQAQSPVQF